MNNPVMKDLVGLKVAPTQQSTGHAARSYPTVSHAMTRKKSAGLTLPELIVNLAIISVLTATTVPAVSKTIQTFKITGAARSIASQLTLSRMRAASSFTQGEVSFNTSNGSFQIKLFNKTTNAFAPDSTGMQYLIPGITFGYGSITTPAGTQTSIAQSTQIIFNSRGIPVDNTGAPTGAYAIYLKNQVGQYYAVTVSVNSAIYIWRYNGSGWNQVV